MKREQFLRRVMQQTGARDAVEAEQISRSVLLALVAGLPRDEASDMASQLPKEIRGYLADYLGHGGPIQHFDLDSFAGRIQSDLSLQSQAQAEQISQGVFTVLKEAVSPGQMEDVAAELTPSLREALIRS